MGFSTNRRVDKIGSLCFAKVCSYDTIVTIAAFLPKLVTARG